MDWDAELEKKNCRTHASASQPGYSQAFYARQITIIKVGNFAGAKKSIKLQ